MGEVDIAPIRAITLDDVLTREAIENVKARAELWVRCEVDPETRAAVMRACKEGDGDLPGYLYFIMMFCSISELRNPPDLQKLPFFPYPYQIRELAAIHAKVQGGVGMTGAKSITLWLKSRDMGMTWLILIYFLWDFLFNRGSFHLGSRREDEVDVKNSQNTLFGKLRFALRCLPQWMLPKDLQDKTLLLSYSNEEVMISGESANPGFSRSKRAKAILMDEFQRWEFDRSAFQAAYQTSNTIFLVGTPEGRGNFYAEIALKKQIKNADVRRVHWSEHPLKARGMTKGPTGLPTSPWYEDQVANSPPEMVAAELDLSFDISIKGPVFADSYGVQHQKKGLKPIPGIPIIRAWDPGGWFAVIFMQIDHDRRVRVLREVLTEGVRLRDTVELVKQVSEELNRSQVQTLDFNFNAHAVDDFEFIDCGDPSGATMSKANQEVPEYQDLFDKDGINVEYLFMAHLKTDIRVRSRIVQTQNAMQRNIASNNPDLAGPSFWVDVDACPILDEALRGGYRRKIDNQGNVMNVIEERHPYNDVVDAMGYGIVYKLGIPEQIKREAHRRTEEEEEDERDERSPRGRSRV